MAIGKSMNMRKARYICRPAVSSARHWTVRELLAGKHLKLNG